MTNSGLQWTRRTVFQQVGGYYEKEDAEINENFIETNDRIDLLTCCCVTPYQSLNNKKIVYMLKNRGENETRSGIQ